MDQSFSHQDNSIEKQHPKPNPDTLTQSKPSLPSDFNSSIPKTNLKYHKASSSAHPQPSEGSQGHNRVQESNTENNDENQAIKQIHKGKGHLEPVPETSAEHSHTGKMSQSGDMMKGRGDEDNPEKEFMKSRQNLTKGVYDYQPYSINPSKSLDFKMDGGIQNSLGRQYTSPTNQGEGNQGLKYKDEKGKRSSREPFSTMRHNLLSSHEKTNGDSQAHKSSNSDINLALLRRPDSVSKLSKSDFQAGNFREARMQYGQESNEIRKLRDENDRLSERVKAREKELQETRGYYDDLYKKYREILSELENYQKEKEGYLAQKHKVAQMEERELAAKREVEDMRQNELQKNKTIRDLQNQVNILKSDINFLNQKNEAKLETMKLEVQRLEEENIRLLQSKKKSETKKDNLIHQLEMSHDEEKWNLQKDLQESLAQVKMLTSKNEELTHKVNKLAKINQRNEREYHDRMNESVYENKRALEENIREVKGEVEHQFHSKLNSLQSKVNKLESENENLRLELQSKPSLRKFKEYEVKIHALETELENAKEHTQEHRKKPSEIGVSTKILREITEELEIENVGEIITKIKEIQQNHKTDQKLVNSLLDLVRKCSPHSYSEGRPSHKQAWNWIKAIMEEYMILKKQEEEAESGTKRNVLRTVMDFLNVRDKNEVPGKLSQVLGDNIGMNKVLAKVKILHKLEWINSLNELEQRIQAEIDTKYEDPYLRSSYYKRNYS